MNPCPCGMANHPIKTCTCAAAMVTKYQERISGPLLDRIDIHIEVPRLDYEKLSGDRVGESSEAIRAGVKLRGIFNVTVSRITDHQITCAMPTRAWGRYGNDAAQFVSARLSSHFQVDAHDCRFSGKCRDPIRAFGTGAAILTKFDEGMNQADRDVFCSLSIFCTTASKFLPQRERGSLMRRHVNNCITAIIF